jgi:hypothetical protein
VDSIVVTVNPGQEVTGMDFTMRKAPAVKIRGRMAGLPANLERESVQAFLKLVDLNDPISADKPGDFTKTPSFIDLRGGIFEIPGVRAGSYEVVLEVIIHGTPQVQRTEWWGRAPVEIGSKDVDGLTIAVQPLAEVRGKVLVQNGTLAALKKRPVIGLQPDGIFMFIHEGEDPFEVSADGTFSQSPIPPGDYKVRVFGLPPNAYVADIRQAGESIYAPGLRVSSAAPEPIEVAVGLDGGAIEGDVVRSDQRAAPATPVVLVPTSLKERMNGERYKLVTTDSKGHFKFSGIAPGPYKVFALQNLPIGAHQNAAFLAPFEARGAPADVTPSSTTAVRLVVIEN